jgi:hypothetical protein
MASPEEELLAVAWGQFEAPAIDDPGELVGFTAASAWGQSRLLIWICDREQEQDLVLEEVGSLVRLSPARRLGRSHELRPSSELLGLLAVLMVRASWGLDRLRQQVTAGVSRGTAVLTGLLQSNRELQHDLKIDLIAKWHKPEDAEDRRATSIVGAVAREYELRREQGARMLEWIFERGLKLPYPDIDGKSTRLSARWDERGLLVVLVDLIARMALPLSPWAGELPVAAQWAAFDEFKRDRAQKRGQAIIREPFDEETSAAPANTDPEGLAGGKEIIALAHQELGEKAARYLAAIAAGLPPEKAARMAGIDSSTGRRYRQQMAALLRRPRRHKKTPKS